MSELRIDENLECGCMYISIGGLIRDVGRPDNFCEETRKEKELHMYSILEPDDSSYLKDFPFQTPCSSFPPC